MDLFVLPEPGEIVEEIEANGKVYNNVEYRGRTVAGEYLFCTEDGLMIRKMRNGEDILTRIIPEGKKLLF